MVVSTIWCHVKVREPPTPTVETPAGEWTRIFNKEKKSYLNLNIENFNQKSIQEILNKGCNYLIMSNIFPRVGYQMLSRISKEKELPELKEVQFDWCVLDDTGKEFSQHFHPCYIMKN